MDWLAAVVVSVSTVGSMIKYACMAKQLVTKTDQLTKTHMHKKIVMPHTPSLRTMREVRQMSRPRIVRRHSF
jgi:hypothetical protein